MRKIICLFLTICALTTTISFTSYAQNDYKTDNSAINRTASLLEKLEIISDYDEHTVSAENSVTRAAFAEYIVHMIKADDMKFNEVYYHDVPRDYWAFDYITILTVKGIVSGDGNNNFNPDDNISKIEAAKILLSLMGYDTYAKMHGGYPTGYTAAATQAKLFKNCSDSKLLTYGDMLFMIENALTGETYVREGWGINETVSKDRDTTILSTYYNMYYDKGKFIGADEINIVNGGSLSKNFVNIEGNEYITDESLFDFLGYKVEFIYFDDGNNSPEIVWINILDDSDVLEITADFYCSFDDKNYTFEYSSAKNSNKSRKAKLKPGITVIFNGEVVETGIDELFKKDRFDLKLVKLNGESAYSVAIIWQYDNYLVSSINKSEKIIYDKIDSRKSMILDSDKYDYFDIFMDESKKDFESISENSVVSVYKSLGNKKLKANISQKSVEGQVKSISEKGLETVITLNDGTEYVYYTKNPQLDFSSGDVITMYLDSNDYIVWAGNINKSKHYGYIISCWLEDDMETVGIRLLNENGKIEEYNVRNKTTLDGQKYNSSVIYEKLKDNQQMMLFKTDTNNEIYYIDTPELGTNESPYSTLREKQPLEIRRLLASTRLGEKMLVDGKTKIFAISGDNSSDIPREERYMIKSKNDLINEEYYLSQSFGIGDDERGYEDILLIKDTDWNTTLDPNCIVVSSVMTTVNSDEDVVEVIHGYQNGAEIDIYTKEGYSAVEKGISEGDIIKLTKNGKGELIDAQIMYDYETEQVLSTGEPASRFRLSRVYPHDKVNSVLKVGYEDGSAFDEIFDISLGSVIVVDSENLSGHKVRWGDMGDIITYDMAGADCSKMIIQTRWGWPVITVIYN